ncbi:hypothetical protein WN51_12906 [Melipona quadrifasciata]|uniref:Uncharacterized protein n=1 Tax=Melipona quadrifasciata TaxID=166423 RepID=A0A0M9ACF4_9HYME|nr:hypothetical protein WN51_12906 [Melipona quadrifasciata]
MATISDRERERERERRTGRRSTEEKGEVGRTRNPEPTILAEHRTRRAMASSSSAIEKLVFIAPLRPGLNHRCSHNFVVSSTGTAHPIPSPSPCADLLSNISLLRRGLLRAHACIFQVPISKGWRMKILPAKAETAKSCCRDGFARNESLSRSQQRSLGKRPVSTFCRTLKSPFGNGERRNPSALLRAGGWRSEMGTFRAFDERYSQSLRFSVDIVNNVIEWSSLKQIRELARHSTRLLIFISCFRTHTYRAFETSFPDSRKFLSCFT